jgi:hypothetical protein
MDPDGCTYLLVGKPLAARSLHFAQFLPMKIGATVGKLCVGYISTIKKLVACHSCSFSLREKVRLRGNA